MFYFSMMNVQTMWCMFLRKIMLEKGVVVMGTIDFVVLIIVLIEHVLNNLTRKKAWNWWKPVKRLQNERTKTDEQKSKLQEKV